MKYLSGLYALNLECQLNTSGDWHTSALDWSKVKFYDSENSIFQDYGIELNRTLPEHNGKYNVANHIRAVLDLVVGKQFDILGDFKNDFICNDNYTNVIFEKVGLLLPNNEISDFMHKIYGKEWRLWIGEKNMEKY